MRNSDLLEMLRGLGRSNLKKLTEIADLPDNDSDDIVSKKKSKKKTSTDDIDGTPDQVIINPSLTSIANSR